MLLWSPLRLGSVAALTFCPPYSSIEAGKRPAVKIAGYSRRRASINEQQISMSKQGDEQPTPG
jgi:hypothetical protein